LLVGNINFFLVGEGNDILGVDHAASTEKRVRTQNISVSVKGFVKITMLYIVKENVLFSRCCSWFNSHRLFVICHVVLKMIMIKQNGNFTFN